MFPDLEFTRKGAGTPLILLHGIGHRRQAWDPILEELSKNHDVIAPDLSGFGESPAFSGQVKYTMDTAVEHLAGQFERWGVVKPHVVGNSLGGAIALELGARGLVSSVTALSPAGFFGRLNRFQALIPLTLLRTAALLAPLKLVRKLVGFAWARVIFGWFLYSHPERHDAEATFGDAVALKYATGFERTARQGIRYVFDRQVPVVTTIAWGTKDRILPFTQSVVARERLPQATHLALEGCGHVPMSDDPERIVEVIEETVTRSEAYRLGK